jgi:hypothetical protein
MLLLRILAKQGIITEGEAEKWELDFWRDENTNKLAQDYVASIPFDRLDSQNFKK